MLEAKLIICGSQCGASDGSVFERRNPVSDDVASRAAAGTRDDACAAANAAAAAFSGWSESEPGFRAGILERTADLIQRREADFVTSLEAETGGSKSWAQFNCNLAAAIMRQAATLSDRLGDFQHPGEGGEVRSWVRRQPVGVVLGIAPWNAPVVLGTRAVAAPLALGNTVVLKASEMCPRTHSLIVECLHEAGLPEGVANLVTHAPEHAHDVVEALIAHPAVRRVNFTGSTRVGREVAGLCARHLKPVLLKLSGKAPLLVLDDADIDAAAEAAVFGAFFNLGQICLSTDRVIVDRRVADAFVEAMAERTHALIEEEARSQSGRLGVLVSAAAAYRLSALLEDALGRGAQLIVGGSVRGVAMQPTILDHVNSSMRIYREEVFGPIAPVIRVSGDEEALTVANDTEYGLSSAIFSRDTARARALADQLEAGICHINGPTMYDDPAMPLGGMKASGYGRFGGEASVHEFTEIRWISQRESPRDWPL